MVNAPELVSIHAVDGGHRADVAVPLVAEGTEFPPQLADVAAATKVFAPLAAVVSELRLVAVTIRRTPTPSRATPSSLGQPVRGGDPTEVVMLTVEHPGGDIVEAAGRFDEFVSTLADLRERDAQAARDRWWERVQARARAHSDSAADPFESGFLYD